MAYINQELKAKIMKGVKEVLPKGWKATAKIKNFEKIILTLTLPEEDKNQWQELMNISQNLPYYSREEFLSNKELYQKIQDIKKALDKENWDNSRAENDYFDVGYYSSVVIK